MELSRAVASTALILAVLLVVGHARGDGDADAAKETLQKKIDRREEARRAALVEHQRRTESFERECRKPLKTAEELAACRSAYQRM